MIKIILKTNVNIQKKIILQMSTITRHKLEDHEKYLKKDLFFTENKWPQFNLLFKDIKKLSKKIPLKSKVVFRKKFTLWWL